MYFLWARHDHNKTAPCGMIEVFELNWTEISPPPPPPPHYVYFIIIIIIIIIKHHIRAVTQMPLSEPTINVVLQILLHNWTAP